MEPTEIGWTVSLHLAVGLLDPRSQSEDLDT